MQQKSVTGVAVFLSIFGSFLLTGKAHSAPPDFSQLRAGTSTSIKITPEILKALSQIKKSTTTRSTTNMPSTTPRVNASHAEKNQSITPSLLSRFISFFTGNGLVKGLSVSNTPNRPISIRPGVAINIVGTIVSIDNFFTKGFEFDAGRRGKLSVAFTGDAIFTLDAKPAKFEDLKKGMTVVVFGTFDSANDAIHMKARKVSARSMLTAGDRATPALKMASSTLPKKNP